MKNSLKYLVCFCFCTSLVAGLAGCGEKEAATPTAEDVKKFKGGGKMTPEEAAHAKPPSQVPPPPPQGTQ